LFIITHLIFLLSLIRKFKYTNDYKLFDASIQIDSQHNRNHGSTETVKHRTSNNSNQMYGIIDYKDQLSSTKESTSNLVASIAKNINHGNLNAAGISTSNSVYLTRSSSNKKFKSSFDDITSITSSSSNGNKLIEGLYPSDTQSTTTGEANTLEKSLLENTFQVPTLDLENNYEYDLATPMGKSSSTQELEINNKKSTCLPSIDSKLPRPLNLTGTTRFLNHSNSNSLARSQEIHQNLESGSPKNRLENHTDLEGCANMQPFREEELSIEKIKTDYLGSLVAKTSSQSELCLNNNKKQSSETIVASEDLLKKTKKNETPLEEDNKASNNIDHNSKNIDKSNEQESSTNNYATTTASTTNNSASDNQLQSQKSSKEIQKKAKKNLNSKNKKTQNYQTNKKQDSDEEEKDDSSDDDYSAKSKKLSKKKKSPPAKLKKRSKKVYEEDYYEDDQDADNSDDDDDDDDYEDEDEINGTDLSSNLEKEDDERNSVIECFN
jgi:hypothetical protein